ncbi:inverse autotransporter beta domain-containing protein [Yersinia intermedia]|uniref:inverse autotransporter beta domain-containing protein n=1 Tax=Yersinia intermedia TaxID=631 RepID=UPI00067AEF02|nr:inverse autotransporter beta-barrel domain-containing protein [Yersinia intermedia]
MNENEMKSHRGMKAVAWTNIFAQLAFPVAAAFTPSVAIAQPQNETVFSDAQLAEIPVKPYILTTGDSAFSLAEQYGLSVEQLKKLNQFRTFSKSFDAIRTGDEIDVPVTHMRDVRVQPTLPQTTTEQALASATTKTAGVLQSSDIAGNLAGQAKSMALNHANQEINNWLSGAGTAKAKLSIDNKGRLEGSELDLLIPLHDTASTLTFTQFGARHIDDRTIANLGAGQRHYPAGDWMLGYNAFFDYDLKRDHSRFGLGLEFARDYLKLGANSYFRTSNWKNSPDVTDYDERPANGFDLRTEAYIPAAPQFGGSLAYEQYYGEDVGLFGKNTRSRNPAALTAGLSYSPFPLLSFEIERKQGTTSGEGDTRFNIGLTYDFNTPFSRQIDPDAVSYKRTLAGTRYDLVERNNEIVLEYRKQELIRLKVDQRVIGNSGETKDLNLSVTAKYGLASVRWDDAALVAAGGRIEQNGEKYSVILPPYTAGGVNSWMISAVAIDTKGNTSKRAETLISVESAGISMTESRFESSVTTLPADSNSTSTLTLTLEDNEGNPVTGIENDIVLDAVIPGTTGSLPTFTAFTEKSAGVYEALMTVGSGFGQLSITPKVRGVSLTPVTLDITQPPAPSATGLRITGELSLGETLDASYTYVDPASIQKSVKDVAQSEDASVYLWGKKGSTAYAVSATGTKIEISGEIKGYILEEKDVGEIIELSLQPRNSFNISGDVMTVDTSMVGQANSTSGGDGNGNIVDPLVKPSIEGLIISGSLLSGNQLKANYMFKPNNSNPKDESRFKWGPVGETETDLETSATVETPGEVPPYDVKESDAGNIIALSVMPRNGLGTTGEVVTDDTLLNKGNGIIEGGENGAVVNSNARPSITDLEITATSFSIGSELSATYQFNANNGNIEDRSLYLWDAVGESLEASSKLQMSTGSATAVQNGTIAKRVLEASDIGNLIQLAVLPQNGVNSTGTIVTTQTTAAAGMVLDKLIATGPYDQQFNYVNDVTGNPMKGLIWPRIVESGQFAGGTYTFTNNTTVIPTTTTGFISVSADDRVFSISINDKSYPLSSPCSWSTGRCSIFIDNFKVGEDNTITIVASNDGATGSSNPGALNAIVMDDNSDDNSKVLLTTEDPNGWRFK